MKEYKFVNGFFREEIEIKRSKFIASVCGGLDEDGCIEFISKIKKEFPDATHNCYAYVADEVGNVARFSDDSEPSGTAGQPMLDTLKKNGLFKTAVVVTRYFGGIKLGAAGLVGAYTQAVISCLSKCDIFVAKVAAKYRAVCSYSDYAALENSLARFGNIDGVEYGDCVSFDFFCLAEYRAEFENAVSSKTAGRVKLEFIGNEYKPFKIER